MPDNIFGFPVYPDEDPAEDQLYSKNKITNGDAEMDPVYPINWDVQDVTVVPGGVKDESSNVFRLAPGVMSEMEQYVNLGGPQAPDYKIKGAFLPGDTISDVKTQEQFYVKVRVIYGIGDEDIHYIPVMAPLAYEPPEEGGS